ncbi:MAG: prolipoprotein diacylglyceryl transferase [Gemmatimonadota bacterium]|nr:MAG: prolipoprotein diacylglyceryl transferase [Gemmatimonadota bacterium]
MAVNRMLGQLLYGTVFVLLVPVVLVFWAMATNEVVPLPVIPYSWAGLIVLGLGSVLMLGGVLALWLYGRGLPMSPYPPAAYVTRGVYRLTHHPIYVGFVMVCFGVAMLVESPSGLWLVSPAVALACVALVMGHERLQLRRLFGESVGQSRRIGIPSNSNEPASWWDRVSVFLLVLVPWSIAFEAVYRFGVPADAVEAYFAFERAWPVLEWTEAIYGSVYVLVLSALIVARTKSALRHLSITALIATAVVTLVYVTVPLIAPPRPFEPQTVLGHALMFERAMSHTVAAFPAFHVIWSLIAAEAWANRSRMSGVFAWTWAVLIAVSCVTTGMHALADIVAAVLVYALLRSYRGIWGLLLHWTERVANSWREWRGKSWRFINHGIYAGIAGSVAFTIAATAAGPEVFWQLVIVHFVGLTGAGLWAQTLEGSEKLSRPFGYYGSVVGAVVGVIVIGAAAGNTMLMMAAIALAAPWVQAIGRLRCLVQGCCHGSPAREGVGIRYWHERSRVCVLGDLRGVPLHPTPLYSILANSVIGVLLMRLWTLGVSLSVIAGVYFILAGIARFIEESYRGEPQTVIFRGLRIYQWFAMISVLGGVVITTLPSAAAPGLSLLIDVKVPIAAFIFGAATGFAMGFDFPQSSRRFARLAAP